MKIGGKTDLKTLIAVVVGLLETGLREGEESGAGLLEGKTEEEKLKIGFEYAMEHIDKIPVACNAAYVENSDSCELEDVHWED